MFKKKISIKFKILITLVCVSCILGLIATRSNKWDKYYKNKLYQSPAQVIVNANKLFAIKGNAIDLGCGIGNETVFLLNQGWKVWAIDSEPKAIQMMKKRNDITDFANLEVLISNFETLNWNLFPKVDCICASKALPFCDPVKFESLWFSIKEKITPSGRFSGHFFGKNYQGFNTQEMKHMTFLTREEVLKLFDDFNVEYFEEKEEEGKSGTGRIIHSHIFEVIAQKK